MHLAKNPTVHTQKTHPIPNRSHSNFRHTNQQTNHNHNELFQVKSTIAVVIFERIHSNGPHDFHYRQANASCAPLAVTSNTLSFVMSA